MTSAAVSFSAALRFWLKLGFISFGGPTGQIAIMHQELVEQRRWISERRFLHALNYCMVLPGPEAQQLATYIGWLMHGVRGGITAGALFVLPSLFILIGLTWIYLAFGNVPAVVGVLYGVKPAVIAIVAFAAYRIGTRALTNALLILLAVTAFVALYVFNIAFPYVVLGAGVVGLIGQRIAPRFFVLGAHTAVATTANPPALIDDTSEVPPHAKFKWRRVIVYVGVALLLWCIAEGLIALAFGWHGALAQMGWFFTKAALLTFGGAYAVLPYVYQGAVEQQQWLTPLQMIDGLGLGETTPGPLIMVVAFVGFVGGWTKALFGSDHVALAGIAGASVATFFTFLPSFLFILGGAPIIEATRDDIKFTAPLSAITAAVVGVIANLAVFFAIHVLWPSGMSHDVRVGFDWVAALLTGAAFLALWRFQVGVIPVIAACALVGLTVTTL